MRKRPEPVPAPRGSPATPPRPGGLAAARTHLWGAGPWGTGRGHGGQGGAVGAGPGPSSLCLRTEPHTGSSGSSCSSERFTSLVFSRTLYFHRSVIPLCVFALQNRRHTAAHQKAVAGADPVRALHRVRARPGSAVRQGDVSAPRGLLLAGRHGADS